jgi:HSP20 family protein
VRRSSEARVLRTGHGTEGKMEGSSALQRSPGLTNVFDDMERIMEETLGRSLRRFGLMPIGDMLRSFAGEHPLSVDLYEDGGMLVLRTDLPGIKREDVDISIAGNLLVISGEKRLDEKAEGRGYVRRETSHGTFRRSVTLPEGVDTEKINATLKDGVLEIRMQKTGETGIRHITVH